MGIGCGFLFIGKKWVEVVQLSWLVRGDFKNVFLDVVFLLLKSGECYCVGIIVVVFCGLQDKLVCIFLVFRLWYIVGLSLEWDLGSRNCFFGDGGR